MALPCEHGNVAHALHTESASRCIDNVLPMPGFLLVKSFRMRNFCMDPIDHSIQ